MNRAATDVVVRTHERQPGNVVRLFAGVCPKCGPDQPIRANGPMRQCGACGFAWELPPTP